MPSDSNPLRSLLSNILTSLRSEGVDELRHSDQRSGTVRRRNRRGDEELVADLEAQQDLYARRGGNSIEVHQHQTASATVRRRRSKGSGKLAHGSDRRLPGSPEVEGAAEGEGGDILHHLGGGELDKPFDGEVVSYRRTVRRTVRIRGSFRDGELAALENELRPERELPQPRQQKLAVPKKFWLPPAQTEETGEETGRAPATGSEGREND